MKQIQKIVDSGLCLGCGLCEAITSTEKCHMSLNHENGFYKPSFKTVPSKKEVCSILKCCPGIRLKGQKESSVWGPLKYVEEAWASDPFIRRKASSGGVITVLAIHLLETKKISGILHVGLCEDSYLYNTLHISRTKEDVIKNSGSRYAPALVLNGLKKILDETADIFGFIGKPCDIAGVKNFLEEFPEYRNRITCFLALFCAGMPSYKGTSKILELAGHDEEPCFLKYRGDGWPGFFEARYKAHPPFKLSYQESWGKTLGKYLGLRCKICPDGIGALADISVGDSWNTKDGYPDFEETDGRSFVMIRTEKGMQLYEDAVSAHRLEHRPFDIHLLKQIQKYQYERRIYVGFRLIPVQLWHDFPLKFQNAGIWKRMLKANLFKGIKSSFGTLKRLAINKR